MKFFFSHDTFGSNILFTHNVVIVVYKYNLINIQYAMFNAKIRKCSWLVMGQFILHGKSREEMQKDYSRD